MAKNTVRIGISGYARILHSIIVRRGTKREIVERGLCGRTAVVRIVGGFHALGLVHVAAWRSQYKSAYRPVYEFGDKPDVPAPALRHSGQPVKTVAKPVLPARISPELLAFHSAFEALQAPSSMNDIAEECGMAWLSIKRLVSALRELNLIYVADWRRKIGGGRREALYMWGRIKPDAPYPEADRIERNRRYRQNRAKRRLPMFFPPINQPAQPGA